MNTKTASTTTRPFLAQAGRWLLPSLLAIILLAFLLPPLAQARPRSVEQPPITNITPNKATQGDTAVVVVMTLGGTPPPAHTPIVTATIGTVGGSSINYDGTTVTATFDFPLNMPTGLYTPTVVFPPPPMQTEPLLFEAPGGFELLQFFDTSQCYTAYGGTDITAYTSADATALQQAVNNATSGVTIKVAGTCSGVQTQSSVTQTVYISQNVTIEGGHSPLNWAAPPNASQFPTLLDAQDNGRVAYISGTVVVTLSNMTLQNGRVVNDNGGGIYHNGNNLTLISNTIRYNSATGIDGDGGGLFVIDSPTTIINTTISQNSATDQGGGLFNENSLISITGSTIANNSATDDGGGIYNNGTLTIQQSDILTNSTSQDGGGIHHTTFQVPQTNHLTLNNSTLQSNSAGSDGGGLSTNNSATTTINNTTFTNNQADNSGGGIINSSILTVTNSHFISNVAKIVSLSRVPTLANGRILFGEEGGGGIASEGKLTLIGSTLRGNITDDNGGAILLTSNTTTISNTLISNNSADDTDGDGGGIFIIFSDTSVTLTNTIIENNFAFDQGGGLFNEDSRVTLENTTLRNNSANDDGGGIYNTGDPLTLNKSTILNNQTTSFVGVGGGIYNNSDGVFILSQSVISGNLSLAEGGGLYNNGTVTVTQSLISNNDTSGSFRRGGGIYNGFNDKLTIYNSTISGNSSTSSGGGIYNQGNTALNYVTLTENRANNSGDSLYATNNIITLTAVILDNQNQTACGGLSTLIHSNGYNLSRDNSCHLTATTDITNTAPTLGPLTNNNGPRVGAPSATTVVKSHALSFVSQALDAIPTSQADCGFPNTADQRGLFRPVDGNGDISAACDIGAYESQVVLHPCSVEYTGDNLFDLNSDDATALQTAVNTVPTGTTIKVAGVCAGVQSQGSLSQTLYISKSLTLQGGYSDVDWLSAPNLTTNPTLLDAQGNGRVALITHTSTVTLSHLIFGNGQADVGAGLYNNATLHATSIIISKSIATDAGGGLYNNGRLSLSHSTIQENNSNNDGGGVRNNGHMAVTNSTLRNNIAGNGGAIHNTGTLTTTASTIASNSAGLTGAGIYNQANLTLFNSTISRNNIAEETGATTGSALYNIAVTGTTTIQQSTIVDNLVSGSTPDGDGALYFVIGNATISNTLLANNQPTNCGTLVGTLTSDGYNISSDTSCDLMATGDLNDTTILFDSLSDNGGPRNGNGESNPTHALPDGSIAIDHIPDGINGCNTTILIDQRGETRPQDGGALNGIQACDVGAYEDRQSARVVDTNATGTANGLSWTNAYTNVQDALTNIVIGDEIWVAAGTYYPDVGGDETNNDLNATFMLTDDISIYGGFAATETLRSQRDWTTNVTILSGDIDNNDTLTSNGLVTHTNDIIGSNSFQVVSAIDVANSATLDGFYITAGKAVSFTNSNDKGGGVYINNGAPTLNNLTIIGNLAKDGGGGLATYDGSPLLSNVTFMNNRANSATGALRQQTESRLNIPGSGGGIYSYDSNLSLTNVSFIGNIAEFDGGGLFIYDGTTININNTVIAGNEANAGGGIHLATTTPIFTNVLFSGNVATTVGGGLYSNFSQPTLNHATFSGNYAYNLGGGIYNTSETTLYLRNSIVWQNLDGTGTITTSGNIYNTGGIPLTSTAVISHSLIQASGGSGASWNSNMGIDDGNNLDADPLFITPITPTAVPTTAGNFNLLTASPALDIADSVTCASNDIRGISRPQNTLCDMGAYEQAVLLLTGTLILPANVQLQWNSTNAESSYALWRSAEPYANYTPLATGLTVTEYLETEGVNSVNNNYFYELYDEQLNIVSQRLGIFTFVINPGN